MVTSLTVALIPLSACSGDVIPAPVWASPTVVEADTVSAFHVVAATDSSITVGWTGVEDGTGRPAGHQVRVGPPHVDCEAADVACDATLQGVAIGAEAAYTVEALEAGKVVGTEIGAIPTCTIGGLAPSSQIEGQLSSDRPEGGVWVDAPYSNVASGRTLESGGIWISWAEIAALPTSGAAWENLMKTASGSCGFVDLADQNQSNNVCVMAKALVYARTGDATYAQDVLVAIRQIVNAPTYGGNALALGRELAAYVIAADVIDLPAYDPALDELFRSELRTLRTTYTWGAAANLIECHERRPNNWGAHCGATRAAIAVYLGDTADLERAARVFKGYLGDRSSYAGFVYGGPARSRDLSWQADESAPVGINPRGATKAGLSIDGVLPDDQRRGGSFTTSPPNENYVWEGLQGLLAQAVILYRAGYPVWDWEDQALLRAVRWLHDVADFPAEGDDTWLPYIVNHYYGTSFPAPTPARYGKNIGWTDWTHG
jgi:hypothetical protein